MSRTPPSVITAVAPFVALLLIATPVPAHQRSLSWSSWHVRNGEATVRLRISELDLSRIGSVEPSSETPEAYLPRALQLFASDDPCPIIAPPSRERIAPGEVAFEWRIRCGSKRVLRIRSDLFAESSVTHVHFARVHRDGHPSIERVLSAREREWVLDDSRKGEQGTSIAGYVRLGVEHILGGYDHVAFLIALLLVARSLGNVARVVTGFTVAHSITLGLSATGIVRLDPGPVEALIGLSIALVAAENLWLSGPRDIRVPMALAAGLAGLAGGAAAGHGNVPASTLAGMALFTLSYFGLLQRARQPETLRAAVAFLFGLLHGFGFASVLLEVGLPAGRVARALLGFNVGVELGQLAIVALLWLCLKRATGDRRRLIVEISSAGVVALGTFWFVLRTFA